MIVITDLGKNDGPTSLFEGVDLQLGTGHRYGLVGANGSSTLTLQLSQQQYTFERVR